MGSRQVQGFVAGSIRSIRSAILALFCVSAVEAQTDPILFVHADSLTTVKFANASAVQDVRPLAVLRGASLDGSLRAGSGHGMAIGGNPFAAEWRGASGGLVRLGSGTHQIQDVDLALPAAQPWVIGRTYSARQLTSGASHRDSNGYQGKNWFQSSQPEIRLYDDEDNTKDLVYLYYGADRYLEFARFDSNSLTYRAANGGGGAFLFVAGAANQPDVYVLTDQAGFAFHFFGFDGDAGVAAGQLWKIVDPAGNTAFAGDVSNGATAVTAGFDGSGRVDVVYDSADRRFTYTYSSVGGTTRLTQVKAETKTGGTWGSPSGVATVGTVDYGYYSSDGDTYGDNGCLKTVTITTPLTDSGINLVAKTYYRYWEGAYDASTNPGHQYGLKLIVEAEGYRSYDWTQDSALNDDPLTATHNNLKPYAAAYFEYDSSHRIRNAWSNGECGCSGGADGEHLFEYESNGSYTDNSGYDTAWMSRTIVQQPDGTYVTQYFDEVHQPLSKVITDADPDNVDPAPSYWATKVTRESAGMVSEISTPANVTAYTHASTGAITASASVGLVKTFTRASSGATKYFVEDRKWKEGTSGTAYLDGSWTFSTGNVAADDTYIIRPVLASEREYTTAVTSGTSGSNLTSYSTTFWSSSLAVKQVDTTLPAVTTGNNGSNSSNTTAKYWNQDGTLAFEKNEATEIAYRAYTNGQVVKAIEDADTALSGGGQDFDGVAIPSGFSSSGTELHWKTTYTYDAQGRKLQTTLPGNRVKRAYFSRLADHRPVTLAYNDYETTPKWYGPVQYTVTNQAGKAVVSAVVTLTSNESTTALTGHIDETDADPITAVDVGAVGQMTTNICDEPGSHVETTRLYHVVPASGAGSDGTNYDATTFGHDDMGRQRRVKAAHGTINRTVFDALGRVSARWIGTNDNGWAGGESSGTDNMVKTELVVYDGGSAGGNSYVTTRTRYIQDNTTGQRVTTLTNDVRGRLLLEANPEAPHAFHKVDNLGRRIATGLFSSTGSIVVGTDDPTTETANRMALSQSFFDEMGRVWKTQRHKIDDADGSDDDNLQSLTWYDAEGQVIKTDGHQLAKTAYDRIGRVTNRFALAEDNDSVYADADDVSGDIVLEESQTTFDTSNGDVIMVARIDRFHDDQGGGETTGALDTNADSDRLAYTAANIEGRIQISSFWRDRFGREEDRVEYGDNAAATFDRDGLSVPARSDTALRTTTTYNTDGTVWKLLDARALETRFEYDAVTRKTKEIRNYGDGTPSGTDSDVTTTWAYTDGLLATLTADVAGTDQVTTYTYGTTKGASAGDSKIATGHLLWKIAYPDSSGDSDTVKHAYNAQAELIWKKDQSGNIVETERSDRGRPTHGRVSTIIGGFDGAVRRVSRTFDSLGRQQLVTQYDNATVGSGSLVDEVKFTYDDWGNVEKFEQDRDGAVSGGGNDYEISYAYEKATTARNTVRRTSVTLPSGNVITLFYGSGDSHDDLTSRVTQVKDGEVRLASYTYNGVGHVVGTNYNEPAVMSKSYATTPGQYPDLDRFNRPVVSKWTSDLASDVDFYKTLVTWDRNANVTRIEDDVHVGFDVAYVSDDVNRLTEADEGTWNGSSITSRKRKQVWELSHTGNWDREKLDLDGDLNWNEAGEHDDSRTHNTVNELTARDTDSNASPNYSLTYDAPGNLTDDGESYTYEYDAFYRLRIVRNRSNAALVAEYRYNGLGFRLAVHEDTEPDGDVDGSDPWYYTAFDERWRAVATFRSSDSSPKEEFVAHQAGLDGSGGSSYIDLVIARDKDANTAWTSASDGGLEERIYYCQNWRADVSALVYATSQTVEWAKYWSYGTPFGLPGGDTDSDGDCDATDVTQIQTWINGSAYDVRGDIDLDGDVQADDKATVISSYQGVTLGRTALSAKGNRRSFAGHDSFGLASRWLLARHRIFDTALGRWTRRDPLDLLTGWNAYAFSSSSPIARSDPHGTIDQSVGGTPGPADIQDTEIVPHTRADICNELKESPTTQGATGCYNGEPVTCVYEENIDPDVNGDGFFSDTVKAALVECIQAHEDAHKDECDCTGTEGITDGCVDTNPSGPWHDAAYCAEAECLAKKLKELKNSLSTFEQKDLEAALNYATALCWICILPPYELFLQ